jgi:hypothetical protein
MIQNTQIKWFMSVIPVTQEAEPGGSCIQGQAGQTFKTLFQKQNKNTRARAMSSRTLA